MNADIEDLRYLTFNRVALRFQHAQHNAVLEKHGKISGDAYSLSAPRFWHPATDEKARTFDEELTKLVGRVFSSQLASGTHDGSFLLISNVEGARRPVEGRSYGPPFLPVGAFTNFEAKNVIGRLDVTRALVTEQHGFSPARRDGAAEKVIDFLAREVLGVIRDARIRQPSNKAEVQADAEMIDRTRAAMEAMSRHRVANGFPPTPSTL